ncbi:hypothetical protein ACIRXL_12060 [Avibacterium paragallinarum]|uniref:hypothetical protein n=1 Tax=Avibacterium paragallinarum TaxID=728 RepID=UPI00397894D5
MRKIPLNPIFESLSPIFKRLSALVTASTLMVTPLTSHSYSVQYTQHNISISTVKEDVIVKTYNDDLDVVTDMIKAASVLTDFIISSLTQEVLTAISLGDIFKFESVIAKLDITSRTVIENNKSHILAFELKDFVHKMHQLCSIMKSEKYKQQSDEVVLSRTYQGKESIGYTYNPEHSFDDFKKAMIG